MRLHRFYVDPDVVELKHKFWLHDERLRNQWLKVLRYREGSEVVLFDGQSTDRLYKITRVESDGFELEMVTEFERKLPDKHVYLFFSLLKKDKNDWVLQKCTEIGVRNFVPIVAERSEKTGFNLERAEKIVIEAAEQCGRSDIPKLREPISIDELVQEYRDKVTVLVCDETKDQNKQFDDPIGLLIGPEGGWTDGELKQFKEAGFGGLHLGNLTLRAETASTVAASRVILG